MLIKFESIDNKIIINHKVFCLEIENKKWFSRVVQSLISKKFMNAVEPFMIWDDKDKKIGKTGYSVIVNPFDLPWNERCYLKLLYEKFDKLYTEDIKLREKILLLNKQLELTIQELDLSMENDYCVNNSWTFTKYLSFLKFKPDINADDFLIENLIKFFNFHLDLGLDELLIFINLKNFLTKID